MAGHVGRNESVWQSETQALCMKYRNYCLKKHDFTMTNEQMNTDKSINLNMTMSV